MPVSSRHLWVLLVVGVLFGLDWLWSKTMTPWFVGLFGKPVYGLVVDSLLKSTLFLVIGLFSVYKLKISDSVNRLIDKVLKMARLKR